MLAPTPGRAGGTAGDGGLRAAPPLGQPNRYGYRPAALEWDLWLDPARPWDLGAATVDHGSPLALVEQARMAKCQCLESPVSVLNIKYVANN